MNRAEIIATVRAHAERQGSPCCTPQGEPVYRQGDRACFIGHLLGDAYRQEFEGQDPWTYVPILEALAKVTGWPVGEPLVDLIHGIDNAHLAWIDGVAPDWAQLEGEDGKDG